MKVALINPETENLEMRELYDQHENLANALLASQLRSHEHRVDIIDLRVDGLTEAETVQQIIREGYHMVTFSVNYATLQSALRISQRLYFEALDKPVIVIGGEHASYLDKEILAHYRSVDIICRGEGEITLVEVATAVWHDYPLSDIEGITYRDANNGEVYTNANRKAAGDLDMFSPASHDVALRAVSQKKPIEVGLLIKRGCPYPCSFCNAQRFLGNEKPGVRSCSVKKVVDEMVRLEPLVRRTGRYLRIYDATFVTPAKENRLWIDQFCDEMERRNFAIPFDVFIRSDSFDIGKERDTRLLLRLRKLGMISTYLGLEAGDNQQLSVYNKKIVTSESHSVFSYLKSIGVAGSTNGFITFFQDVTLEQIKNSVLFLQQIGMATLWNISSRAETLPGIKLNQQTEMHERYTLWDVTNYSFSDPRVAKLYQIIQRIKSRFEFVRYEDRLVREVRDRIKIGHFYRGELGYFEDEQQLDEELMALQSLTVNFLLETIGEMKSGDPIPCDQNGGEAEYAGKMESGIRRLMKKYQDNSDA